jgi:hypothetical protein
MFLSSIASTPAVDISIGLPKYFQQGQEGGLLVVHHFGSNDPYLRSGDLYAHPLIVTGDIRFHCIITLKRRVYPYRVVPVAK